MQIFYINTKEYILPKEILEKYNDKKYISKEKEQQHKIGRFIVEKIAKEIFNIENTEIEIINKKPKFRYSDINFSISHSNNIVLVAFDKNPIGADIEEMKDRNFKEIFERYNYKGKDISKETFYKFWTEYEATIKLQEKPTTKITTRIEDIFTLSVVGNFDEKYSITKIYQNKMVSIK